MNRLARSTLLLLVPILSAGCGAIFHGTRQDVTATSAPDQASVVVEPGGMKFTTPASFRLERKNDYIMTFTKAGYSDGRFQVQKSLNAGILVLDILAGLVGVIVDAATGAWYSLNPTNAQVVLTKINGDATGPDEIRVTVSHKGGLLRVQSSAPGINVDVEKR